MKLSIVYVLAVVIVGLEKKTSFEKVKGLVRFIFCIYLEIIFYHSSGMCFFGYIYFWIKYMYDFNVLSRVFFFLLVISIVVGGWANK